MLYFDTSFLTPLMRGESTSAAVERFIMRLSTPERAISHWTRVEFASVLARDVRMRNLASAVALELEAKFDEMLSASFVVLLPSAADFDLAKAYIDNHETGLRTGDAMHLAIAHNHRCEAIYSLDKGLLKAGRQLGLPVSTGISVPR